MRAALTHELGYSVDETTCADRPCQTLPELFVGGLVRPGFLREISRGWKAT
jgi:hypothetical protein